jgi:hypothetical protein
MSLSNVVTLTAPTVIFARGAALLSYRFFAVYRGWSLKELAISHTFQAFSELH